MKTKTNYMNITKVYSYHGYEQLFIGRNHNVKVIDRSLMCVLEDELNAFVGKDRDNKTSFVFEKDGHVYAVSFWDFKCIIVEINVDWFRNFPCYYDFIRKPHFEAATLKDLGLE